MRLGLPEGIEAVLFDLDGVLTATAVVHAAAWRDTFDAYLRERDGSTFVPFSDKDYQQYVDGRPREDGVRTFLASRGITLPEGSSDDPPGAETIASIAGRKNASVLRLIREKGVDVYPGSLRYLEALRAAGLRRAVVSASANCAEVLRVTGLEAFVEGRVDGVTLGEQHLRGKPEPDSFLAGARLLDVEPEKAAVVEDALSGVEAGRKGGFGYVIGVDRVGHADALRAHGADIVVEDLAELLDGAPR